MNIMNILKKINVPDNVDVVILPDINGDFFKLIETLSTYKISKDSLIIVTGNIVGDGNNNLPSLLSFSKNELFETVMGLNEFLTLQLIKDKNQENLDSWVDIGGQKIFNQLGEKGLSYFDEFLSELPLFLEIEKCGKKFHIFNTPLRSKNSIQNNIEYFSEINELNRANFIADEIDQRSILPLNKDIANHCYPVFPDTTVAFHGGVKISDAIMINNNYFLNSEKVLKNDQGYEIFPCVLLKDNDMIVLTHDTLDKENN